MNTQTTIEHTESVPKTFKYGDVLVLTDKADGDQSVVMLCQVGPLMACLICLESGNRMMEPIKVKSSAITNDELDQMCSEEWISIAKTVNIKLET